MSWHASYSLQEFQTNLPGSWHPPFPCQIEFMPLILDCFTKTWRNRSSPENPRPPLVVSDNPACSHPTLKTGFRFSAKGLQGLQTVLRQDGHLIGLRLRKAGATPRRPPCRKGQFHSRPEPQGVGATGGFRCSASGRSGQHRPRQPSLVSSRYSCTACAPSPTAPVPSRVCTDG